MIAVNWMALRGEITDSNKERNKLEFDINIIGVVIGIIVILVIGEEIIVGTEDFTILLSVIVPISIVLFLIAGIKLKERPELYGEKQRDLGLIESIKFVGKSKAFIIFAILEFFGAAAGFMGVAMMFLQPWIIGVELFEIIGFSNIPIGLVSGYLFVRAQDKFDPYKMTLWVSMIGGLILSIIVFLFLLPFNAQDPNIGLAVGMIIVEFIGAAIAGSGIYFISFLYTAIDESELETGVRQDGVFMGIQHFIMQVAEGIGPILATFIWVLSGYAGTIIEGMPSERVAPDILPASVILGLKVWSFIFGLILTIIMIALFAFYPIKGEKMIEIKTKLAERRKELKARETPESPEKPIT